MSVPVNKFLNFNALSDVLNDEDLYELRTENDSAGRVLYVGKNLTPNASTTDESWYIKKLGYDSNGFLNRVQLPDNGIGFTYCWDCRATYFS